MCLNLKIRQIFFKQETMQINAHTVLCPYITAHLSYPYVYRNGVGLLFLRIILFRAFGDASD